MQKIAGAFLHLWQGEEFRLWSHLSPLKCAEVCQGCSGRQQRKYGRLIQQNQLKKKASEEAMALDMGIPISLVW